MKQIGLFGGTFNPIHLGHLRAALEVKEYFNLDQIYLIPSAIPPHKETIVVADANDRLEMLRLAAANHPDLTVSDIELNRPGPSYTIDTVRFYKASLPDSTLHYLIMGIDAFLEIDLWKSFRDLFDMIPFIVISRPDPAALSSWKIFEGFLKSQISKNYEFQPSDQSYRHATKKTIFIMNVTAIGISSTRIRELAHNHQSLHFLVPPNVENFIETKGIYQ